MPCSVVGTCVYPGNVSRNNLCVVSELVIHTKVLAESTSTACHSWCHFQNIKSCTFSDPTVVNVEDYTYSWRNTVLVEKKKITKRWSHHGRRPWCSKSKFSASLIIFRIIHPLSHLSHSVPSLVGVFCIYHHLSSFIIPLGDGNRTAYESITQLSHSCGCFSRNLSNLI